MTAPDALLEALRSRLPALMEAGRIIGAALVALVVAVAAARAATDLGLIVPWWG